MARKVESLFDLAAAVVEGRNSLSEILSLCLPTTVKDDLRRRHRARCIRLYKRSTPRLCRGWNYCHPCFRIHVHHRGHMRNSSNYKAQTTDDRVCIEDYTVYYYRYRNATCDRCNISLKKVNSFYSCVCDDEQASYMSIPQYYPCAIPDPPPSPPPTTRCV